MAPVSTQESLSSMSRFGPTYLEFFAGGGMARAGLGKGWRCAFANDFDPMKVATYVDNYGNGDIQLGDIAELTLDHLPANTVDLSWASFPCQDLSLAGDYRGLGREGDDTLTRSGTFWPFWKLMRGLVQAGRGPRTIVLENVYGVLTSHGGKDFGAITSALSGSDYRFGAMVINAALFVPHSRPRVFFVAVHKNEMIPTPLVADGPQRVWHPPTLVKAHAIMAAEARKKWLWWNIPAPAARNTIFADLIEGHPTGVDWDTASKTKYLLALMSDKNLAKVTAAKESGRKMVGGVYRRTRTDEDGIKRQRAEVRFDDIAGCLRTPSGGSSRQTILVVNGKKVRSRLLSPREAARLMGLSDNYRLPTRYNDAYHVCGDGVCAPVVRHLAQHILEPVFAANQVKVLAAAE